MSRPLAWLLTAASMLSFAAAVTSERPIIVRRGAAMTEPADATMLTHATYWCRVSQGHAGNTILYAADDGRGRHQIRGTAAPSKPGLTAEWRGGFGGRARLRPCDRASRAEPLPF